MIYTQYGGRLGNNMFQYCFGRILAEELGYDLIAPPIFGFAGTEEKVLGSRVEGEPERVGGHQVDIKHILALEPPKPILLDGFYQRYEYYKPHKDKIKEWLRIDNHNVGQDDEDIIIHLRLGDDITTFDADNPYIMPFSFYEKALENTTYNRVYICSEPETINSKYIKQFDKYDPIILNGDTLSDFRSLKSFKKIIISQSTFSWWAAFLSDATEIFFPLPAKGNARFVNEWSDGRSDIDLVVSDEPRYKYIKQNENGWL
tara:strand:+ start:4288 stop:5064 length:777 start_codon:yes stop_codon:yes gene_type:complete